MGLDTNPLRFKGSKGLLEEATTAFCDESTREECLLGLEKKKKRKASAEAKAPKTVAVETRVRSREFMEVQQPRKMRENLRENQPPRKLAGKSQCEKWREY